MVNGYSFRRILKPASLLIGTCLLGGCISHQLYRTSFETCVGDQPAPHVQCDASAIQSFPTAAGARYLLSFVEFDDQGQLWNPRQMDAVETALAGESASKDLLMIAFVHGWKHSAAPGDRNVETFRRVIAGLADTELQLSRTSGRPPREVAGIYLGWRGGSVNLPLVEQLTFWDRKNTAQKVGHGGVTEVLTRLELIKRIKNGPMQDGGRTRFVTVGHSFGGAVVFTALAQVMTERFVQTPAAATGAQSEVSGFGDLVVLINPAFEAMQYAPLSGMAAARGYYFPQQLPVVAQLTSERDEATRIAFPIGRWFSTMFEKERTMTRYNATTRSDEQIDGAQANVTAIGHFESFRTHRLDPARNVDGAAFYGLSAQDSAEAFYRARSGWFDDEPGGEIEFGPVVLHRTLNSAARNPFLMIQVDKELIAGHNHIDDPRVIEFLKQLILLSTQTKAEVRDALKQSAPDPAAP